MLSKTEFESLTDSCKQFKKAGVNTTAKMLKFIEANFVKESTTAEKAKGGYRTRDRHLAIQSTQSGGRNSLTPEREVKLGVKVRTKAESERADNR